MVLNIAKEVAALKRLTTPQLRVKYAELFQENTNANNKPWLIKRIAWRLQVQAEGDLSERARLRADRAYALTVTQIMASGQDFFEKTGV